MLESSVSKITPQAMSGTLALFVFKLFCCSSFLRRLGVDGVKRVQNRNAGYEVKYIKDKRCRKVVRSQIIIFPMSGGCMFPRFLKVDKNIQSANSPYLFFF